MKYGTQTDRFHFPLHYWTIHYSTVSMDTSIIEQNIQMFCFKSLRAIAQLNRAHTHTRTQSNTQTHKRTWTLVVSRSIQFAGIQNKISLFYAKSGWVNEYVIYLKLNAATYWLNSKTQTPYHQSEQGVMTENYVIGSIRCVVFRLYNALVMLLNSASNTIISKILKIQTVLVNIWSWHQVQAAQFC